MRAIEQKKERSIKLHELRRNRLLRRTSVRLHFKQCLPRATRRKRNGVRLATRFTLKMRGAEVEVDIRIVGHIRFAYVVQLQVIRTIQMHNSKQKKTKQKKMKFFFF